MSEPVRLDLAEVAAAAARLARTREARAVVPFFLHLVRSWAAPSAAFAAVRDASADGGWRLLPSVVLGSIPVGIERTLQKVEEDAGEALTRGGVVQPGEEIAGVKARDNWAVPFWFGEQAGALFLRGVPRPAPEGLADALALVGASVWPRLLGSPSERLEALLAEIDAAAARLAAEARRQAEALTALRQAPEGEARAEKTVPAARAAELEAEIERLVGEAHGARAEADALRQERDALQSRAETTEPLAADAKEAQAAAAAARAEAEALRSDAEARRAEVESLRVEAATAREKAVALEAEAGAARDEAVAARRELDAARADSDAARQRLEALRAEADSGQAGAEAQRAEAEARRAEADALRQERDAAREEAAGLRAERGALTETAARAEAARSEAEAAKAEAGAAREQADRGAAEAERLRAEAATAAALAAEVATLRARATGAEAIEAERAQLAERIEERRRASDAAEVRTRKAEEELAAAMRDLAQARARAGQIDEERRRRLEEAEATARELSERWESSRRSLRAATAAARHAAFLPPAVRVSLQEAAGPGEERPAPWLGAVLLDRDLVSLEPLADALEQGGLAVRTAGHPEEIGLLLRTADAAALDAVVCDVMAFRPDQNVAGLIRAWDRDRPGLAYYVSFDAENAAEVERARRIPTSIIAGHVPRPLVPARLLETLGTLARKRGRQPS